MSPREAVLLVYGLIFGTSTPYLKPKKRFLFPTSMRNVAAGFDLFFGGSGVCARLETTTGQYVVNLNQGDAARKWVKEIQGTGQSVNAVFLNSLNGNFADAASLEALVSTEVYVHAGDSSVLTIFKDLKTHDVSTTTRLRVGDETIVLIPVIGAATATDMVVYFESRSIMMFGALFYNRVHPELAVGASSRVHHWIETLESLIATYNPAICVPAEGDSGNVNDVREFMRYLKTLTEPEADFSYCRQNFDWIEIPSTTSLEENYDTLRRNKKTHTSLN